ncbi:MAG: DEAD/DEAH box helicase [Planctomycetaceae bacterium]|nr:DEAD/DEAH box helicase [Planctomycetaceae bacterium]
MDLMEHMTALDTFHPCTRDWFRQSFDAPTTIQTLAWPAIGAGHNALLLAPTGSGKTLAAFLAAIDHLFFRSTPNDRSSAGEKRRTTQTSSKDSAIEAGVRVLYISPLKALGVDVDRNLRAPLAGLRAFATRHGVPHIVPSVAVRSGDTSQRERSAITRQPPEILITTPESLYLMLTSQAESVLTRVETVIIDEIHALAGTKRGVHLFVTLERLERLRQKAAAARSLPHQTLESDSGPAPLQRVGLSATQRPLELIARLLGGGIATASPDIAVVPRPVQIIDASERRAFELTIETPAEERQAEMNRQAAESRKRTSVRSEPLSEPDAFDVETPNDFDETIPIGPAASSPSIPSVWPSIHPRLVELIRQNRSTMIFVNSRRLAERLATAINETAGEELALAHHGSIAREQRAEIEDRLKRGQLPAMVATSSMELGIDMGAVDLVIQIEAPPSIASGMQRIGRAGHHVGAVSTGVIFPKYRGDLLACSAATGAMLTGWVEETHFPRNPLDILAQQIVAITARESISVEELYSTIRGAAPFFDLPWSSFIGVLDLLSGRYPSDEFSELRPRLNWDRIAGMVSPRKGAQRLAILNGGTIPDRGLYGVFLTAADGKSGGRVGELDEEMVFECHPGDVFLLGASSWRVMDITRDRVLVTPAPGEPGRMPFWRGDSPGRPRDFGVAIGQLARELIALPESEAIQRLTQQHFLDLSAAESLLRYLRDQVTATGLLPSDTSIVIESFLDEVGDWRIVILSPYGSRVHAPWALLAAARLRREISDDVDLMWTDDGIVFRIPEACEVPPVELFLPEAEDVEDELVREIGGTALFAAKFRENAARSLLLPRRSPNRRTPLWMQRRRSADLLKVAARFRSFPILMETYRECLRDVFDMSGFLQLLRDVRSRAVQVHSVRTDHASPFASAVLFNYVGNFIYEGDAPLAERRAQTLSLDHTQLRELLGSVDFRELFDADVLQDVERERQRLSGHPLRHPDDVHGLLLDIGPLSEEEIAARCPESERNAGTHRTWLTELIHARRIFTCRIAGDLRFAAAEEAGRLRDALGIVPPTGLADAFLEPVLDALTELVSQYARTHGPFSANEIAARFGLGTAPVLSALSVLTEQERVIEGEFRPHYSGTEWCDAGNLRILKRRSLAALRREVEPVETDALARFLPDWHGIHQPRSGLDGLLDVIEQLQGAPLPASTLEHEILPVRLRNYSSSQLDELCVQREVIWRGFDSTGSTDGRIGLFLTDDYRKLAPPVQPVQDPAATTIRQLLSERGALFFDQITDALRLFPNDVLNTIWQMVWAGELTNDTLTPLRSLRASQTTGRRTERRGDRRSGMGFRSRRRTQLPGSEGRWTLLPGVLSSGEEVASSQAMVTSIVATAATESHVAGWDPAAGSRPSDRETSATDPTPTERQMAIATQLIERHGVLTKEMLAREEVAGGFSGLYPVLKAMEEAGRVRRGYFVSGLGAAQFAAPGAEDRLRSFRDPSTSPETLVLAATDPASPWGNALSWPETTDGNEGGRPQRVAGAKVLIHDGRLLGYLGRTHQSLMTFLPAQQQPDAENDHTALTTVLANAVAQLASPGRSLLLTKIDGLPAQTTPFALALIRAGFTVTSQGLLHRGIPSGSSLEPPGQPPRRGDQRQGRGRPDA